LLRHVFPAEFLDYQAQTQSFTEMSAYRLMSFALTGQGEPEQLNGMIVSANYFSLLGVGTEHGRVFEPTDGLAGAARVAIISHDFWQTRFGGDRNVIGKTLTLSGESVTLIGVMPRAFKDTSQDTERQIWLNPHQVVPDWELNSPGDLLSMRNTGYLWGIARLKPKRQLATGTSRVGRHCRAFAATIPAPRNFVAATDRRRRSPDLMAAARRSGPCIVDCLRECHGPDADTCD
jgi:hypothetical protein